jgi:hypothetical protein
LGLQIGERLLIANHMGQSLGLTNHKYEASVKSASHCLTRLIKLWKNARPKPISWAKPAYLYFSKAQSHIRSTTGESLPYSSIYSSHDAFRGMYAHTCCRTLHALYFYIRVSWIAFGV